MTAVLPEDAGFIASGALRHIPYGFDWLDLFLETFAQVLRRPVAVLAQAGLLANKHFDKGFAVLVFLELFEKRFLRFCH